MAMPHEDTTPSHSKNLGLFSSSSSPQNSNDLRQALLTSGGGGGANPNNLMFGGSVRQFSELETLEESDGSGFEDSLSAENDLRTESSMRLPMPEEPEREEEEEKRGVRGSVDVYDDDDIDVGPTLGVRSLRLVTESGMDMLGGEDFLIVGEGGGHNDTTRSVSTLSQAMYRWDTDHVTERQRTESL